MSCDMWRVRECDYVRLVMAIYRSRWRLRKLKDVIIVKYTMTRLCHAGRSEMATAKCIAHADCVLMKLERIQH